MFKFIRSRIQVKLVSIFVLVLLASAIIVSQIFASFSVGLLVSGEQASESGLVRSQVQTVASQLSAIRDDEIALSLAPATRLLVEAMVSTPGTSIIGNFQDSVIQFLSTHPAYATIAMIDLTGKELARVDNSGTSQAVANTSTLTNRKSSPYFIEAFKLSAGGVFVSGPESVTGGSVFRYSTPLYASTGDTVGVLTFTASSRLMTDPFLSDQGLSHVYLLDKNGNYILNSDSSDIPSTTFGSDQPNDVKHVLSGTAGSIVQSADRPDLLQTYEQFTVPATNALNFTVVREKPMTELLARTNGVREGTFLVFGIAVVILAMIMWFLMRPIVRPLRQLEASAKQISLGNFDTALPTVRSLDEVGALATAFSSMSRELRLLYKDLDQRVQARTSELAAVAKVSSAATRLLETKALINEVVSQTQGSFGFDFVDVLLVSDPNSNQLISNSRGVQIQDSDSLVAQVARERKVQKRSLADGSQEIALPLIVGGQFLGVFDVLSAQFAPAQEEVLVTLADQIAVALLNAKQYEGKVAEVQGLLEIDVLKNSFLANMSHELRTPLNAVINFTDFVLQGWYGDINSQQAEQLRKVINESDHLLSLINDILDLTKLDAGMMELFREEVDINEILAEVVSAGNVLLKDSQAVLVLDIEPNLPKSNIDRRRVKQILLNLVSNAAKFTHEGTITIGAHYVNNVLEFFVRDTGVGVAPQYQELIFERFRQAKEGTKTAGSTGLGLPISRALAVAHGGRLWVDSVEGKGSTFYVTIPVEAAFAVAR